MRKCSSFMCVLVVLLAGGAEAQRPVAKELLFGITTLGVRGTAAWTAGQGCQKFSEIYSDGEDLVNRMWNDAFEYSTDEDRAYTMWWFEGGTAGAADAYDNPNNAITAILNGTVPDQCHLDYYHKDAPTAEGPEFTECHPWHASSCCHDATVVTPEAMKLGYGAGYEWDRCGPLSQACERFFVMEACFYECEVNAGLYRKFTDAQHAACSAAEDGAYIAELDYTCQVSPWGGNAENKWQMYKMPIKASFADAWYRACANDLFCGGGDYFDCANDYHAQVANDTYWEELRANQTAAALADAKGALPTYGMALVVAAAVVAVLLLACVCLMAQKERAGKPVFKSVDPATKYPANAGVEATTGNAA
jgi:folate receptor